VGASPAPEPTPALDGSPPAAGRNSTVGTRCCASATINPTRTRSTASLPDHVCATSGIFSQPPPKREFRCDFLTYITLRLAVWALCKESDRPDRRTRSQGPRRRGTGCMPCGSASFFCLTHQCENAFWTKQVGWDDASHVRKRQNFLRQLDAQYALNEAPPSLAALVTRWEAVSQLFS